MWSIWLFQGSREGTKYFVDRWRSILPDDPYFHPAYFSIPQAASAWGEAVATASL